VATAPDGRGLGDRRITVTGGAGFLGRRLVAELARRGANAPFVPRRADYDLTRPEAVDRMYADARPEIVFHLAAVVGGIGANQDNPGRFLHENLVMGAHLIDGARRAEVQRFVAVGTVCAYPAEPAVPFREETLWDGLPEPTNAPYGLAKRLLLAQCQAYRQQYGLDAVYVIPTNLYGPGDDFDPTTSHVIPALIRKMVEAGESGATEIQCWGDGDATRDFLHVDDAAEAICTAGIAPLGGDPVNLGSGTEVSIRELAVLIADACGYTGRLVWDSTKPSGQRRRVLDTSRARERLGFVARRSLDEGLRETVRWYREHRSR
jgi:GDP-L-fucose synthase